MDSKENKSSEVQPMPLFVTFYTKDTPYEELVEPWSASIRKWGYACDVQAVPDKGQWAQNCAQKGPYCRDFMGKYQKPFVWLDLDAEVIKDPQLFRTLAEYDMAVNMEGKEKGTLHLVSNVVYFNHTPKTLAVLARWAQLCEEQPSVWDQKHLQRAVEELEPNAYLLPRIYSARYKPRSEDEWGGLAKDVVIQQFQVSRIIKQRKNFHPETKERWDRSPHAKKEQAKAERAARRRRRKR